MTTTKLKASSKKQKEENNFLVECLCRSQLSRSQQELRQQSREKLDTSQHALDHDDLGPIRIRNLEDLIRYILIENLILHP